MSKNLNRVWLVDSSKKDDTCPGCKGKKTGKGFSNCCGVEDTGRPYFAMSYAECGICPECKEPCDFDYTCQECDGRGYLTEGQLYPGWTSLADLRSREVTL